MKLSLSARIALICLMGGLLFLSLGNVAPKGAIGGGPPRAMPEATTIMDGTSAPIPADAPAKAPELKALPAERAPISETDTQGKTSAPNGAPLLQLGKGPLPWELQIREATARAVDGTAAAKAVLGLLGYLPEEALEAAVEQALNRLPDHAWRAVALPFLLNPQAHGRVLNVLFADLMERQDEVSLPCLRQLAGVPLHPLAPFALDNLRLLLGEDFKLEDKNWEALLQARKDAGIPPRTVR